MDTFELCCQLLSPELKTAFKRFNKAEELRLRCGQKPSAVISGKEIPISESHITENDILHVLECATGASIHSAAASLSKGFVNYKGLRLGVCGQAIFSSGDMLGFRKYSSLSIRIPHEISVIPEEISQGILREMNSTLIAAAPGAGKTTALRELIKAASDRGARVAVADERGELAGPYSSYNLGPHTDLISDMPKAEAATMLLRTMNPTVIAMDEITSAIDMDAVFNIIGCGVSVFASAHGRSREEMLRRPIYRRMFEEGVFRQLMTIRLENGKREYRLERLN